MFTSFEPWFAVWVHPPGYPHQRLPFGTDLPVCWPFQNPTGPVSPILRTAKASVVPPLGFASPFHLPPISEILAGGLLSFYGRVPQSGEAFGLARFFALCIRSAGRPLERTLLCLLLSYLFFFLPAEPSHFVTDCSMPTIVNPEAPYLAPFDEQNS